MVQNTATTNCKGKEIFYFKFITYLQHTIGWLSIAKKTQQNLEFMLRQGSKPANDWKDGASFTL
jgi:hypothetical protein